MALPVPDWGSRGRGFGPRRPDQRQSLLTVHGSAWSAAFSRAVLNRSPPGSCRIRRRGAADGSCGRLRFPPRCWLVRTSRHDLVRLLAGCRSGIGGCWSNRVGNRRGSIPAGSTSRRSASGNSGVPNPGARGKSRGTTCRGHCWSSTSTKRHRLCFEPGELRVTYLASPPHEGGAGSLPRAQCGTPARVPPPEGAP